MSRKHPEPSLAKRKPIVPKSVRFTGGALDPGKRPVAATQEQRIAVNDMINDLVSLPRIARKLTTGRP